MQVAKGDVLHAVETTDGGYLLTPYDPDKLAVAGDVARRYRNTLRVLAK